MIAYFDCFAGIAGDMTLGALIDCGVPVEKLIEGLSSLPISGWNIEATPVLLGGIHAINVRVTLDDVSDDEELHAAHDENHTHDHSHGEAEHSHDHSHHGDDHDHKHHDHSHDGHTHTHPHDDDHTHSHSYEHHHDHDHAQEHSHPHIHGRSMAEIRAIIEASDLSEFVKETSLRIFGNIAIVEAELHHSTPEEIHFHEIGGVDSLIDICGTAWCLEYLGVKEVYCSALPYSTGYVDCAHGRMPVPAPATLKLLRGAPMVPTGLTGEMVTPTGAGIVGTLTREFGPPPAFTPRHVGFGGGKKKWADRPNLLRVIIGDAANASSSDRSTAEKPATPQTAVAASQSSQIENSKDDDSVHWQTLSIIETNIDDMNPEFFDLVFARLFEAGAVDVWLQNVQMKKNRPGSLLSALCAQDRCDTIISTMLRETTTLGVRVGEIRRAALPRQIESVRTEYGEVRMKVARWPAQNIDRAAPEYDDVARLAKLHDVAARDVYQAAVAVFSGASATKSGNTTSDATASPPASHSPAVAAHSNANAVARSLQQNQQAHQAHMQNAQAQQAQQ
jgi:hypothetical protein